MTIEQKAKRYDEALKWMRSLYPAMTGIDKEDAEHYFPELRESEDEKIRKAIHIYLDWLDGRRDYQPKGEYTIKDMIAWLEKQDEKKPTDEEMKELLRTEYEKGRADAIAETQVAWSEEDKVMLDEIIDFFENGTVKLQHDLSLYASWLKALKQRITNKQ